MLEGRALQVQNSAGISSMGFLWRVRMIGGKVSSCDKSLR